MTVSADLATDAGAPLTASADFTLGTDVLALLDRQPPRQGEREPTGSPPGQQDPSSQSGCPGRPQERDRHLQHPSLPPRTAKSPTPITVGPGATPP